MKWLCEGVTGWVLYAALVVAILLGYLAGRVDARAEARRADAGGPE